MRVRDEYPRPQFVREKWKNLNGKWQFQFDDTKVGMEEKWYTVGKDLRQSICVPFVYQCRLSGIEEKIAHDIVWYKKRFSYFLEKGKRLVLHFGAVDYEAWIFVNGQQVKYHFGGHTSFSVDITDYLVEGEQEVCVCAKDEQKNELIPRGKQFWEEEPMGIWYTNSTGIWQTVWLEEVDQKHIFKVEFTTLFEQGKVQIRCYGKNISCEDSIQYIIKFKDSIVARGKLFWQNSILEWDVDLIQNHIFRTNFHNDGWCWTPENPNLFDVMFQVMDEKQIVRDEVVSYFGFRKIHIENGMVYLNNKPYYQKLVLDQGYWPDSLLTAPNDEAFIKDIELSKKMGFNGCRKHQKMEDPRFLYWADKLGYLVWGECASPPMYQMESAYRLMNEWTEIIERDYNHPCIIVWVPMNESWGVPHIHSNAVQQHFSQALYHYIHAIDNTRLVISNDGWEMTKTDICAIHNYMHGQKNEIDKYNQYKEMIETKEGLIYYPSTSWAIYAKGFSHQGEPIMLTEFGGIAYDVSGERGWGYTTVKDEKEFLDDYRRIMQTIYASSGIWGYCYTQLTDVEQEINGLLTYDRKPKCDLEEICKINNMYHKSSLIRK